MAPKRPRRRRARASADPVVALVQALIGVLRRHATKGYRRLAQDPAFWAIVERLQKLRPEGILSPFDPDGPESIEGASDSRAGSDGQQSQIDGGEETVGPSEEASAPEEPSAVFPDAAPQQPAEQKRSTGARAAGPEPQQSVESPMLETVPQASGTTDESSENEDEKDRQGNA